ncbi:MAG: TetR/AcrR family transcriptional regulator [Deltaproteobacteria bacterium]|nr:TetR/AcrR family transcriptional regulator [Deltaproteobacteria bacterium]
MKENGHPIKAKRRTADAAGKPPKPERRIREELMKAALRQFTWRGYAATTVRELVEEAGVTKPVLYYYFGSKEGLFLELMRTHFGRLEAMVDRYRQQQRRGIREQLTATLNEGFSFARKNRDFFRLLHAVYYGPPGEAPFFDFDAYHQRYHDLIAELLAEGITRGEFRPVNAGDMAWIILGTMEMAIEDQISDQTSQIDRETFRRLLDLIFDGLSDDRGKDMKG